MIKSHVLINNHNTSSDIPITATKEESEFVGTNLCCTTQEYHVLPLTLECTVWLSIAQGFIIKMWHHKLSRSALKNPGRVIFVQNYISSCVIAVGYPARCGCCVEMQQILGTLNKLSAVSSSAMHTPESSCTICAPASSLISC